jgi:hypothetical protein
LKLRYEFQKANSVRDQHFSRGQVEWALWKLSTIDLPHGDEPMSAFRARVKHLLQLDRAGAISGNPAKPLPVEHALVSEEPRGKGIDAAFRAFDAFCLAIALDFLRAGFKQSEVLLLMLHLRPRLEEPFAKILSAPPTLRPRPSRKTSSQIRERPSDDDRRVFLVIQRVEFSEAFPAFAALTSTRKEAIFREPVFCKGIEELRDQLDMMDHFFRRAIVLEIAHTAARTIEFLNQAPLKRRGRPAKRV